MQNAAHGEARPGTVYWIDHYVCNTTDVARWGAFHTALLGARNVPDPQGRVPGLFQDVARCRIGGFVAVNPMPPTLGLGKGLPRYGFYIDKADIDAHMQRLERVGAVHGKPIRTTADGEAGTVIHWQDPDGNQLEFWAPDVLPEGALTDCGPERVGRISHAIFESRDLDRTAAFFERYCMLARERGPGIGADTLVLRLAAGGRIIYKQVDELGGRTTGTGLSDTHTALLVRSEDFFLNYARVWAELPEFEFDPIEGKKIDNALGLPARTVLHPSPGGRKFHAATKRGDDFFDWDTNLFHFYGGTTIGNSTSMQIYDGHSVEEFVIAWERTNGDLETLKSVVPA